MIYDLLTYLPVAAILIAAVLCGYWLGRKPGKSAETDNRCECSCPDPMVEEVEAEPVPAECLHSAQLANSAVSSALYDFNTLAQLAVTGCWQARVECNATENYCRVTTETKLQRFVKVETSRGGLLIRYTGKRRPTLPMTIEIKTTGTPEKIKGTGANSIVVENAAGNTLCCKIADNGRLLLQAATVEELTLKLCGASQAECRGDFRSADLDVTGASAATFPGEIRTAEARVSGASKLKLATAGRAELEVSGASKVRIGITEKLSGDVAGGSTVKYSGNAEKVAMHVSGSSKVKAVDAREAD